MDCFQWMVEQVKRQQNYVARFGVNEGEIVVKTFVRNIKIKYKNKL